MLFCHVFCSMPREYFQKIRVRGIKLLLSFPLFWTALQGFYIKFDLILCGILRIHIYGGTVRQFY